MVFKKKNKTDSLEKQQKEIEEKLKNITQELAQSKRIEELELREKIRIELEEKNMREESIKQQQELEYKKREFEYTSEKEKKKKFSFFKKKDKQSRKDKKEEAKLIKFMVDGKEYSLKKEAFLEFSKKEYKLKQDQRKIADSYVLVLFLRESGNGEFKYVKPENGMFIVEGNYYHIKGSCVYNVGSKRIPLAVIPEWSFIPLSKKADYDKLGGNFQEPQKLIIKSMENAEIVKINQEANPDKKKMNPKVVVIVLIVIVVGFFLLQKFTGGGA